MEEVSKLNHSDFIPRQFLVCNVKTFRVSPGAAESACKCRRGRAGEKTDETKRNLTKNPPNSKATQRAAATPGGEKPKGSSEFGQQMSPAEAVNQVFDAALKSDDELFHVELYR